MSKKTISIGFFQQQFRVAKAIAALLMCLSFIAAEVVNLHNISSDTCFELCDFNGEEKDSAEGEGKEDTAENNNHKLNPPICLPFKFVTFDELYQGYCLLNYQPEDYQEIPQPPPEV